MLAKKKLAAIGAVSALVAAFTVAAPMNSAYAAITGPGSSTTDPCLTTACLMDQAAAATAGDTIYLAAGTVFELTAPVVLNGASLKGVDATTVIKPTTTFTTAGYPTDMATAMPLIVAKGASVTISNLAVTGPFTGSGYGDGIYSTASKLTVDGVTITKMQSDPMTGVQIGHGIIVQDGDAVITNTTIASFQKRGIVSFTDGHVAIDHCKISGPDPKITGGAAFNAIVVFAGTTEVTNTQISDLSDPTTQGGVGVFSVYWKGTSTSNPVVTATDNTFDNVDVALTSYNWDNDTDGPAAGHTARVISNDNTFTDVSTNYVVSPGSTMNYDGVELSPDAILAATIPVTVPMNGSTKSGEIRIGIANQTLFSNLTFGPCDHGELVPDPASELPGALLYKATEKDFTGVATCQYSFTKRQSLYQGIVVATVTPLEPPEVAKVTVTYDANNAKATGKTQATVVDLGFGAKVADNGFTLDGYTFTAWNTKADGTGVTVKAGETIPELMQDVTLYAQWKANAAPEEPSAGPSKVPAGGSVLQSGPMVGFAAVVMLVCAGGVLFATRRHLTVD